ncbi:MAG: SpoIIE family protein phosphatase [Clostridia bacterium]|nr:SpoIIE family protein phosphatase [Clostridia bacterium]MDE7328264.1 SpoIIE family protein phosphatase [Clostridia bacterium]
MKINGAVKQARTYILIALLTFLCQQAQIVGDYKGYALALFIALIYCRFNIAILSCIYLAICLICDHTLYGIIYATVPIVVMLIAKYLHYLFAKPMRLYAVIIYAFICVLPLAVVDLTRGFKIEYGVYLVSIVVVALLSSSICYALCVRGVGRRLSGDEIVGGFVLLTILSNGVYAIDIYGFRIFYLLLGLAIPYLYRNFSLPQGIVIISAIAVGGGLTNISLAMSGGIMLIFLTTYLFSVNKWIAGLCAVLTHIICGLYFRIFPGLYYLHLIGFTVGVLVTTCFTNNFMKKLPYFKSSGGRESAKELVNRSRRELASRLNLVSGVFYEMSEIYAKNVIRYLPPVQAVPGIAQEITLNVCGNCINKDYCRNILAGELSPLIEGVVRTVLTSGKATLEDLPTFLSSKCIQLPTLLSTCNRTALAYDVKYNSGKEMEVDQKLISGQLLGVSDILASLGEEVKSAVNIDDRLDARIVEELGYNNIVCSDVMTMVKNGKHTVSLIVREGDRNKKALTGVLSKLVGATLEKKDERKLPDGRYCLNFINTAKYKITYATAACTKPDSSACGDTYVVTKLKHDKVLIALCDGMGTGAAAREGSQLALDMVSSYYRAGFDNVNSLMLVNRLLAVVSKDNFNALDMCVVDLELGIVDFIKQGGVQSLIKRLDSIQIIDSNALPLGIVEEATPQVQRQLIAVGEMVVMFSDGIMETLTLGGIKHILNCLATLNPQQICDEIINQAKALGLKDDSSVVVFRLCSA